LNESPTPKESYVTDTNFREGISMNETAEGRIVRVSEDGRATIPKELRDESGIETPGRVRFRRNEDGEIVVEPVPRPSEMRGAGRGNVEGNVGEILEDIRRDDKYPF